MSVAISVIAVGKNKPAHVQYLVDDYIKRTPWKINIIELNPPNVSDAERKAREAVLIREAIPNNAVKIVLDERGKALDSVTFAKKMETYFLDGKNQIAFIIGGADGLDESLRRDVDLVLCFGAMTWPHMMVRLMLAEQLYRASMIIAGHPYHRQ